ncbi:MAG: ABC transporter substrate-binding protein [Lewinellaceae bacterium]|nr:ABC transporter substrate-binding protein [Lewinellaceae bacterium]
MTAPFRKITDQMNRKVKLSEGAPKRIISLVPSQTEFLFDLGLEQEVVGITKFCVHPSAWFQTKARVGGTKTLHFDKIAALQPDLIIGNKEENERAQIEALAERYPVWLSDIVTLDDALDMMLRVGRLTGRAEKAQEIVEEISASFQALPQSTVKPGRAAYFIWRKPYMVAANGTFIYEMMRMAGFENVFADLERYPEITLDMLAAAQPDCIFLSSEPYPFAEKHIAVFQEACPDARIRIVDGEMFSWYGSRLRYAPDYFRSLWETLRFA